MMAECIDVSAEMTAQEKLQDREELLRNLIEEMPDGLLQLDRELGVVYHNPRLLEIVLGARRRQERLLAAARRGRAGAPTRGRAVGAGGSPRGPHR